MSECEVINDELLRQSKAATCIQSVWRGWHERQPQLDNNRMQEYEQRQMQCERMRISKQKQLQIISMLPASDVETYLQTRGHKAVVVLQSWWRGVRIRRHVEQTVEECRRHKAAIRIQRQVREWLMRSHGMMQASEADDGEAEAAWSRLVDIDEKLNEWVERHREEMRGMKYDNQNTAFHVCQQEIRDYNTNINNREALINRLNLLMARCNTDAQLLENCPSLSEIQPGEIYKYRSESAACRSAANEAHRQAVNYDKLPWWKKLSKDS